MDDSRIMRGVQGISNLECNLQDLSAVEGLTRDEILKRLPFQKLHDNEGLTFPFIDFMNGADVGVVET